MPTEILTSVTFEDGPSVGTLLADRDRLAAENARLREAGDAVIDSCYWHSPTGKPELNDGGYVEVHPALLTALRAVLAARSLTEAQP